MEENSKAYYEVVRLIRENRLENTILRFLVNDRINQLAGFKNRLAEANSTIKVTNKILGANKKIDRETRKTLGYMCQDYLSGGDND
jgi:hypothetical protein